MDDLLYDQCFDSAHEMDGTDGHHGRRQEKTAVYVGGFQLKYVCSIQHEPTQAIYGKYYGRNLDDKFQSEGERAQKPVNPNGNQKCDSSCGNG